MLQYSHLELKLTENESQLRISLMSIINFVNK
jgi:hypothetical protein